MKDKNKEKENLEKLMALRNVLYTALKANIMYNLIRKAKNIPGMDYKHLNYMTERVADEISKKNINKTIEDSVNIVKMEIKSLNKLEKLVEETTKIDFLKQLLKDYEKDKINYDAKKIQEGHELLFGDTEVNKL